MDGIRPQGQEAKFQRETRPLSADAGDGAPFARDTFEKQDRSPSEIRVTSFASRRDEETKGDPTKEPSQPSCSGTCGEVCDCGPIADQGSGTAGKLMTAAGVGGAFAGGAVG